MNFKKLFSFMLVLLLGFSVIGCGESSTEKKLDIMVNAGLKKPMGELIEKYQKEKGVVINVSYGASGSLYSQIHTGQPCDIFFSANYKYIDKIDKEDKRLKMGKNIFKEKLVLVVSEDAKDKVKSIQDIIKEDVTLAITDKNAPVGVYSETALNNLGMLDKLNEQENIKARPSNVANSAMLIRENQVDATLLYKSTAVMNDLSIVDEIDNSYSGDIVFGVALLSEENEELAKAFLVYLENNYDMFEKYGLEFIK
ncbi:molybdate ABC transporter substrate-binding protein [Tepidibacter aestuarii]|uniref:molybdate ABC transporter substrate-binding protein n=1 Tax=Tepidibacter aestuarii TaxID=2925782 RepID=UPI0020C16D06|nr:molybdate ABC transporter substrate-binding protein [Tepidibacter aestuarii]CAH2213283.1 molybdate transport system substrate-binding protein [Tepidibacter aestuarii]